MITEKTCPYCGKTFIPYRENHTFCSKRCYDFAYKKEHEERLDLSERKCPQCGRMFKPKRRKSVYCSRECREKSLLKGATIKVCKMCGKTFTYNETGRRLYCSQECSDRAYRVTYTKSNRKNGHAAYHKCHTDGCETMTINYWCKKCRREKGLYR